jgi:two-component system chemotaxis response regulator CheY
MAKVLVVDDSELIRTQVNLALTEMGHQVIEAVDGQDGYAKTMADLNIDLIIADYNMPVLDGLGMTKKIRTIDHYLDVTVIILTTETSPDLRAKCRELGIRYWIVKPMVPEAFKQAVTKVLAALSKKAG